MRLLEIVLQIFRLYKARIFLTQLIKIDRLNNIMKFKENKVISLEGPVEKIGNKLLLRIPLEVGGLDLLDYTRKIGSVVDDDLVIIIPDSLAERLNIKEGNVVNVNNKDGKFNIEPKT